MNAFDADALRETVSAAGVFARDRPLVAMISGGRDSTCLLDVAVALLGAPAVCALHLNYGLREQSAADERCCRELCERLEVELRVLVADPGEAPGRPAGDGDSAGIAGMVGSAPGDSARDDDSVGVAGPTGAGREDPAAGGAGNLQAWARERRYAAAEALAVERDALIATGHTASDQVETILYRLAASPGRRALLGMPAGEGRLIRPLLALTREQTAAYCVARGLVYCDDESNADLRFARARVRHEVLPALRGVHPAAERNVLRTAALLREETELLDGLVDAELGGPGARGGIELARLREMPPALARMVVVRLAEHAAGTYVPQAGERVAELLELARRGGRAELHVGGRAGAVLEDGMLRMVRLPPRGPDPAPPHGD